MPSLGAQSYCLSFPGIKGQVIRPQQNESADKFYVTDFCSQNLQKSKWNSIFVESVYRYL